MKKKKKEKEKKEKNDNLVIYFMPNSEINGLDPVARVKKILGLALQNKIIILQGKLRPEEEAKLIEYTMTLVGNIKGFQGVEIATISGEGEYRGLFHKVRHNIAKILVGEQDTMTIVGPANVVKSIKRNPKKIELMLKR